MSLKTCNLSKSIAPLVQAPVVLLDLACLLKASSQWAAHHQRWQIGLFGVAQIKRTLIQLETGLMLTLLGHLHVERGYI